MTVGREADAAWFQPRRFTRERTRAVEHDLLFADNRGLLMVAGALWVVMTLWKFVLAANIGVVWEEAHFVVAGMHPALAYPDIPAGWPLFARACIALFGWSPLAVRVPALIVAQGVPFAIYFLALPVTARRNAIWAAIASTIMPPLAASGAIFYSEATMQLLLALMLGAIIRAGRSGRLGWWILTGVTAGLGLFVHYRFAVAGVGVLGFALFTRAGRTLCRAPGFWLAGALAAAGLAPSVLYSLAARAPALSYHLVGQQHWGVSLSGPLIFVLIQAMICTPVFFAGMVGGSMQAARLARTGDGERALLLWVGGALFGLYALISPFDRRMAPQWPIEAYVPLIVFLPQALETYVDSARTVLKRRMRITLVGLGPVVIAVLYAAASVWTLVAWPHPERVPLALRSITTDYERFSQFEPAIARATALARARFGAAPLLATSGHVEAVKLEFPGKPGREVYALGDPREVTAHFDVFRAAIHLDQHALLAEHAGAPVVILLPESTYLYDEPDETAFRAALCQDFTDVQPVEAVEAQPGRLVMHTFIARVGAPADAGSTPCPFLPQLYIARPKRTEILRLNRGNRLNGFSGLAASPQGVARIDILLDGRVVGQGKLGQTGSGGPPPQALAYDPDYPRLRFTFDLPKAALTPGPHRLSIDAVTRDGAVMHGEARTIYAEN